MEFLLPALGGALVVYLYVALVLTMFVGTFIARGNVNGCGEYVIAIAVVVFWPVAVPVLLVMLWLDL